MKRFLTAWAILGGLAVSAMGQVPSWWRDYNAGGGVAEQAISIGVDANGNVYSAGTAGSSPNTDILVVSYSPTGAWRWTAIYNGPGNKDDRPVEIAVDANGDVYLVGMSYDDPTMNAMVTQKYDGTTGVLQWSRPHIQNGLGQTPCIARGIALGPSGTVYACGAAEVFNEFLDAYVCSQSMVDGSFINMQVYGANLQPAANQIAEDIVYNGHAGMVFVVGSTADNSHPYSSDASDMFLTRSDAMLTAVWTNTFDGYGKRDIARNVAVRNNDVFVFGNATTNPATYPVLFLVKADGVTGAEVWRKLRTTASDIEMGKMVLDAFGNPTLLGNIDQFASFALRYRGTDGYLYWERVFGDLYSDLAVDSAAATYVVGSSTMKLSHTGATLWNSSEAGGAAAVGPGNVLYTNRTQFNATADLRTIRWFQAAFALTLSPSSTVGGVNVTGTIKSNLVAPPGGLSFTISENSIYVATAQGVTIPAGATQANFTIFTAPNKGWTNIVVPITATLNGATAVGTLTILPPVPQSLVMSPNVVQAGLSSTGTVALTGKAPGAGLWVALSDNSSAASTPIAVKVQPYQTSAQFVVQTTDLAVTTVVTISAKSNGVTRTATLTINP
ncbi:MAG: hypothetical protein IT363_01745 [Methanoregulaceae archaeon]|nr:hypothetical protein [Methanoregulaceae archaeon]